ncbi:MAG TPA: hypothetical protein IAA26_01935 [Candidatus Blautia faecipullorum]|nr:hypothetical protein [Candidatus Blautia faecipullorum]
MFGLTKASEAGRADSPGILAPLFCAWGERRFGISRNSDGCPRFRNVTFGDLGEADLAAPSRGTGT